MSGSGGGSGTGGFGAASASNCGSYVEETYLNSPVPDVLDKISLGDILIVDLQKPKIVVATSKGKVAGSLTPQSLAQLIECLEKGFKYVAEVKSIKGARCQVLIRPKAAK